MIWSLLCCLCLQVAMAQPIDNGDVEQDLNRQRQIIEATNKKLLGRTVEAIEQFKSILKSHPDNALVLYELGTLYLKEENLREAKEYAERAYQAEPDNVHIVSLYTDALESTNDFVYGATVWKKFLEKYPEYEQLYYRWAFFEAASQRPEQAVAVLNLLQKRTGLTEELAERKFYFWKVSGNQKKAAAELEALIALSPTYDKPYFTLGTYWEEEKKPEEAKKLYERLIKLQPDNSEAKYRLVKLNSGGANAAPPLDVLEQMAGDAKQSPKGLLEALKPYRKGSKTKGNIAEQEQLNGIAEAIQLNFPNDAALQQAAAELLLASGKIAEAIAAADRAIGLDPNQLAAWVLLLQAIELSSDAQGLLKRSEDFLDLYPNQAEGYLYNGKANSMLGKFTEAIDAFGQAQLLSGKNPILQAEAGAGMAIAHQGNKSTGIAKAAMEKALALQPENPRVLERAGDLAFLQNDLAAALSYWNKALPLAESDFFTVRLSKKIAEKKIVE